jgi:hypothetical protein
MQCPSKIRTCATRFRKSLDDAYSAFYQRLSYVRDWQPSRHTTPDDPGSRHKPCHGAHPSRCLVAMVGLWSGLPDPAILFPDGQGPDPAER